jgi:hypothetical protein
VRHWPGYLILLTALGAAVQLAAIACQHQPTCPACAPTPPPQFITRRERCMDPPPALPSVVLPPPDAQGRVILDRQTLAGLAQVIGLLRVYLDTQYARCALPGGPDAGTPAP